MESTLTASGRATIPKAIRDHLGVGPGDRIRFFIHPDGSAVILSVIPTAALKGMLCTPERKIPLAEMDEAITRGASPPSSRRR